MIKSNLLFRGSASSPMRCWHTLRQHSHQQRLSAAAHRRQRLNPSQMLPVKQPLGHGEIPNGSHTHVK